MPQEQPVSSWRSRVAPVTRTTAEARATYDRLARWYDVVEAPFERRPRSAGVDLLAPTYGEVVLELGSGTGQTLDEVAARVGPEGHVVGVDLSHRMLDVARARLARRHHEGRATLLQADARRLPVAGHSVDAVTTGFTLELMPTEDIPVVLGECRRVLRPGGRLVVVSLRLPEAPDLMTRLYVAGHRRWPRVLDCRPLPLEDVLTSCGWTVLRRWSGSVGGVSMAAVRAR